MNAPDENAMNSACSRRSFVSPPIESLIIANWPVSTASRHSMIDANTTHAIGKSPYAPYFAPTRSFDASAHSDMTVKYRCTPSAPTMKGCVSPG